MFVRAGRRRPRAEVSFTQKQIWGSILGCHNFCSTGTTGIHGTKSLLGQCIHQLNVTAEILGLWTSSIHRMYSHPVGSYLHNISSP